MTITAKDGALYVECDGGRCGQNPFGQYVRINPPHTLADIMERLERIGWVITRHDERCPDCAGFYNSAVLAGLTRAEPAAS